MFLWPHKSNSFLELLSVGYKWVYVGTHCPGAFIFMQARFTEAEKQAKKTPWHPYNETDILRWLWDHKVRSKSNVFAAAGKCGLMVDSERKRGLQRKFNRGESIQERKRESMRQEGTLLSFYLTTPFCKKYIIAYSSCSQIEPLLEFLKRVNRGCPRPMEWVLQLSAPYLQVWGYLCGRGPHWAECCPQ